MVLVASTPMESTVGNGGARWRISGRSSSTGLWLLDLDFNGASVLSHRTSLMRLRQILSTMDEGLRSTMLPSTLAATWHDNLEVDEDSGREVLNLVRSWHVGARPDIGSVVPLPNLVRDCSWSEMEVGRKWSFLFPALHLLKLRV